MMDVLVGNGRDLDREVNEAPVRWIYDKDKGASVELARNQNNCSNRKS